MLFVLPEQNRRKGMFGEKSWVILCYLKFFFIDQRGHVYVNEVCIQASDLD